MPRSSLIFALAAVSALAAAPVAHGLLPSVLPEPLGSASCYQTAPGATSCDLGEHVGVLDGFYLSFGATLQASTALVVTYHPDAFGVTKPSWTFCSHVDNVNHDYPWCPESGPRTAPGDSYSVACYAYGFRTTTPGGSGDWGCGVSHAPFT